MTTILISIATNIVLPLVGSVLVPFLGVQLANLISSKVKSTRAQDMLLRVSDLALTVVKEVAQTMQNAPNDQKKSAALESLRSHLGAKGIGEVMHVFGFDDTGLQAFLTSKVESVVFDVKAAAATKPSP